MKEKNYSLTVASCYVGYVVQAIVNNLSPLLFVQFGAEFGINAWKLSLIVIINFGVQIFVDSQSAAIALKLGYRRSAVAAQSLCVVGLLSLGVLPYLIEPFVGLMISTVLTAAGSGFIEVILSPLIEALPLKNKSGAMCVLHSFYSWGHLIVILAATLFFNLFSVANWRFLPFIMAIVPLVNTVMFSVCPIETLSGDIDPMKYRNIFKMRFFLVFIVLMLAAGAAEQAMAQWASYFAQISIGIADKTVGDMFGGALFALGMAISRLAFGFVGNRMNLKLAIILSGSALFGAYLLAALSGIPWLSLAGIALGGVFVGIMWPGVYALAGAEYPKGGTKMFGMLALAGDVGCMSGPALVGLISADLHIGLLVSSVFPLLIVMGTLLMSVSPNKKI